GGRYMLTPQELQNKKFEKAVFGGYDMAQVDDFLDSIIGDYTDIYKENITLKSKMKVLVDKIEEYRSVDDEIRKMLYTAQTKSKEMIANAEKEANNIINEARSTAESSIIEMKASYDSEKDKLAAMKAETSQYAEQIKAILNKNIEVINTLIETAPVKEVVQPKQEEEFVKASPDTFEFELPKDFIVDNSEEEEEVKQEVSVMESHVEEEEFEEPAAEKEVKGTDEYSTKFFELHLGKKERALHKKTVEDADESDTGKIYGTGGFTPKPKFQFDDLRFGSNYDDDYDDNKKKK
ncbi:MAG: DivIVA domain-containing protein, partial [Firmicutes bacterium]|nr:DivIVA domain-containing protein [Bacillota bacterium]